MLADAMFSERSAMNLQPNAISECLARLRAAGTPLLDSGSLRFVVGAGFVNCSVSPNGQHWAHLFRPANEFAGPLTHLGLLCSVETPDCQITLKKIVVRKLPAFSALAGDAAMQKAIAVTDKQTMAQWLPVIMAAQPAEIDDDAWRIACALKSISAGAPAPLAAAVSRSVRWSPMTGQSASTAASDSSRTCRSSRRIGSAHSHAARSHDMASGAR